MLQVESLEVEKGTKEKCQIKNRVDPKGDRVHAKRE